MFQYQIARGVNGIRVLGDDLKNKCHSSCGMLKNTHCSVAVIGYHSSKIIMVTSPYELHCTHSLDQL